MAPSYLLPHHPSLTSLDPLSICEDPSLLNPDGRVTHRTLIFGLLDNAEKELLLLEPPHTIDHSTQTLEKWSHVFCNLISSIAYSLHSDGNLTTGFLAKILASHPLQTLQLFRKHLFTSARDLELLFPEATLPFLSTDVPMVNLTPQQTDALLAHLFLGTLQTPKGNEWGRPGFVSYFADEPPVEGTVDGYVRTLIRHFADGGYVAMVPKDYIFTFTYCTSSSMPSLASNTTTTRNTLRTHLVHEIREPSQSSEAVTYVLIAAHSQPGPGPGGTHEEKMVGQSPPLAIVSLLTPVLSKDAAVVTGLMPVHAQWSAYGRGAKLERMFETEERVWRGYIVADALELDGGGDDAGEGVLEDLKEGNVEREIKKLFAGFRTARELVADKGAALAGDFEIQAVPWGCQAFGGNLVVKAQCMMMAAALAGVQGVELAVPANRLDADAEVREIEGLVGRGETVGEMFAWLTGI